MARIPNPMVKHVIARMAGGGNGNYRSPSGAITQESGGGFKVNDLNPSNGIQNFGTYPTREAADAKLRAIEYFKHHGS